MKKILSLFFLPLVFACGRTVLEPELPSRQPYGEVSHGLIELGEKLQDPYSVENVKKAVASLYPTKAGRVDVVPTDYYVRFLPKTEEELRSLEDMGLYLVDHPMDYRILREGDYYHDPSVGEESITWQYSVVPEDFEYPRNIRWELLDECYIPEHDLPTRSSGEEIDWRAVEEESFRLTGNGDMLLPRERGQSRTVITKGESAYPSGRITVLDPALAGGKPVGLSGVTVACNVFVKIAVTHTDRDGYYTMPVGFSSDPRYRLVFSNSEGFSIGLNLILVPASVSTLGSGSREGIDYCVTEDSDPSLFRRCAVNNAAYNYYTRCSEQDLGISAPPGDLRIWILPMLESSATVMLHHGAVLGSDLIKQYLGEYVALAKIFLPDITIGTSGVTSFSGIYNTTVHELAHASHYSTVGNDFWNPYVEYIVKSFVLEGFTVYGYGFEENHGLCEIGEMWAYFLAATLQKDRYGGSMPSFGYWFRPEIFGSLYERGVSRKEIFLALKPHVRSIDDLKDELMSMYPEREDMIVKSFKAYGK